jgi:hypothetical protein
VPHSVFSGAATGGGSGGQRTSNKRGSSERPAGARFDHDRARFSREFEYDDSEDVFSSSVPRRPISAGAPRRANYNGTEDEMTAAAAAGLLFKTADLPVVDDGDPWVDTDSVGSESDLAANGEI